MSDEIFSKLLKLTIKDNHQKLMNILFANALKPLFKIILILILNCKKRLILHVQGVFFIKIH